MLSENPGLGPLSTTIRDGLVGDQSWPTRRGEGVNESHKIVGHASFADEGPEGLLSKQEEQEYVEAGFLTGQTDRQSVMTARGMDVEDRRTGLMVISHVTSEPSSGNNGQHTTSISVIQDDDNSSLSVVPGRPPAGYQDDNRPATIGYQPDSIPVTKPTLTGDRHGMEADITPQLSQGQPRRVKDVVKDIVTIQDRNKELCSHDKEGTCAIHGKGAKKVVEPIWITKVGADGGKTKVKKKKYV